MILFWRKRLKVVYAVLAVLAFSAGACRAESEIWETAVPSRVSILRAVWGHSAQGIFAVGDAGMILHFDGSGWRTLASGTDRDLAAVWGSDPEHPHGQCRPGGRETLVAKLIAMLTGLVLILQARHYGRMPRTPRRSC